jgi:hypothetical protein
VCGTLGIPHAHITGPAGLKEKNQYNTACSPDTKYTRVSIPNLKKNAIIFSILVYSNSTQNKGEGSGGDLEIGRVAPARDREGAREDQLNWEEESEESSEMEDRETLAAGEAWAAGAGVATMAADQRTHFFFFTRD